jgi:GNAT superfamily N-acetyltransferase
MAKEITLLSATTAEFMSTVNPTENRIEVTRTYLQMLHPSELKPARIEPNSVALRIERVGNCPASFYRYLYSEVGRAYRWVDRLPWSDEQIRSYLDQPEISVWVMYCEGAPAGFFELKQYDDRSVEIVYFGLLPESIGKGLGKHLLTEAIEQAWSLQPSRVWLHTCTLDSPAALPNYTSRGFQPYQQDQYWVSIA